jgi:hypothetical protein
VRPLRYLEYRRQAADRRAVACHECSHVVLGRLLGLDTKAVDLYDQGPFGGIAQVADALSYLPADADAETRCGAVQANILTCLAGPMSDHLLGLDGSGSAGLDYRAVWRHAFDHGQTLESIRAVAELEKVAHAMVKNAWPAITRLANELLLCRSLDRTDINHILER